MNNKKELPRLLKGIKFFFINYLFCYFFKIENKFQQNPKKFYLFAVFFTLIIFSFTFFPINVSENNVSEKKEGGVKEEYTVIESTNLLSVNRTQLKGKKVVFHPRLSKEERTSSLSDFVPIIEPIDFNTLLIKTELNISRSEKIKNYYQQVLGGFIVKKYFKFDDSYITTGLIQELLPTRPKRKTSEKIRE